MYGLLTSTKYAQDVHHGGEDLEVSGLVCEHFIAQRKALLDPVHAEAC